MVQQITLTTDPSIPANYAIDGVLYPHPTTRDLLKPTGYLDSEEVSRSTQFQEALDAGYITLVDELANNITNVQDQVGMSAVSSVIISNSAVADDLEIGYFDDLTPEDPNAFGVRRRSGGSGYFAFMPNAQFPQVVLGSPTGTNQAFIDVTNNGQLFLNQLDTGVGTPSLVSIGTGGLVVNGATSIITADAAAGGLNLDTLASSSNWDIFAGSTANFDNWLRFSNSGSVEANEAVLTNDGAWRVLNGSAGAPGLGFINASNYGVFVPPSNDQLGFSTAGTARLTIDSSGNYDVQGNTINGVANFNNGTLLPINLLATNSNLSLTANNGGATTTALQMTGSTGTNALSSTNGSDLSGILITPNTINHIFTGTSDLQLDGVAGTLNQVLSSNGSGLAPTWKSPTDLIDKQFVQSVTQQVINFGAGGGTGTGYTLMNDSAITANNTVATDYEITASFLFTITNSNNRTVQFAIFVNGVETIAFIPFRVDQANDDKSYTRRWNLNIPAGATVDWRVQNINAASDFELNERNFTIEEF